MILENKLFSSLNFIMVKISPYVSKVIIRHYHYISYIKLGPVTVAIIIIFHNVTYEKGYKHINQTILDGNLMNTYLIIMEGKYYDINADDSTCHGYYIIKFSSSPHNLQAYLSIYGQVISSGEMVCEGTYYFPINMNYHFLIQITKSINTIVSLRKIINGNTNIICYDLKDFYHRV